MIGSIGKTLEGGDVPSISSVNYPLEASLSFWNDDDVSMPRRSLGRTAMIHDDHEDGETAMIHEHEGGEKDRTGFYVVMALVTVVCILLLVMFYNYRRRRQTREHGKIQGRKEEQNTWRRRLKPLREPRGERTESSSSSSASSASPSALLEEKQSIADRSLARRPEKITVAMATIQEDPTPDYRLASTTLDEKRQINDRSVARRPQLSIEEEEDDVPVVEATPVNGPLQATESYAAAKDDLFEGIGVSVEV